MKWPADAPRERVLAAPASLGFRLIRQGNRLALTRLHLDGTTTPMTIPNHRIIKGSTLRAICPQAGLDRERFLAAYEAS